MTAESWWLFAKNLFFLVVVPGTFGVYLPLRVITRASAADAVGGPLGIAAGAMVVLGGCGLISCIWEFGTRGRGTPAPFDPPTRLVVRGLYRIVRNPMYLSMIVLISGWALLFRSGAIAIYAAAAWASFHLFVLLYEEPVLSGKFGAEYEAYRRAVGRWLPGRPYVAPPAAPGGR